MIKKTKTYFFHSTAYFQLNAESINYVCNLFNILKIWEILDLIYKLDFSTYTWLSKVYEMAVKSQQNSFMQTVEEKASMT